ncbi:hypothetical protein IC582_011679 [Cucumis melo]|uniref:Mog1/PsbP/DUF1795-like photosystem II reaction center PsbP family protein isoform 1 n=2 Tax=Cucumis melo TaxID=3656 RepID=A0A5A7VB73_CUCMM|nr:uncharacterized protein LOC103495336 [Cucumis melo]KAA0063676.1 Mog1/PsbP/DUF1795-like photosystem II reaction center PsbP family protein isoform 1 [Cucumis melo var. makuwa]TYK18351.1 Mog1/PsbP/DUF1795-like photosystem II reaction center PsbP family protein isoform 1 [Cucumis melo var. makuwa]
MAIPLSLCLHHPPNPHQNPTSAVPPPTTVCFPASSTLNSQSKRHFILKTASLCLISFFPKCPVVQSSENSPTSKPGLPAIANTKSWFQFYGDGFSIRVPPQFEDLTEPEDYSAGLSLYGDKAKTKTFAARFGSPDGSEVLSVVTRPTNQLKITFLEAKDITDIGSLREAAKIFVPGGSTLFSARTFKIKEDEGFRTYYFYEFGKNEQHVALVATVNSGQVFVAGATAPLSKWDEDGIKLRSAAISLTVL